MLNNDDGVLKMLPNAQASVTRFQRITGYEHHEQFEQFELFDYSINSQTGDQLHFTTARYYNITIQGRGAEKTSSECSKIECFPTFSSRSVELLPSAHTDTHHGSAPASPISVRPLGVFHAPVCHPTVEPLTAHTSSTRQRVPVFPVSVSGHQAKKEPNEQHLQEPPNPGELSAEEEGPITKKMRYKLNANRFNQIYTELKELRPRGKSNSQLVKEYKLGHNIISKWRVELHPENKRVQANHLTCKQKKERSESFQNFLYHGYTTNTGSG